MESIGTLPLLLEKDHDRYVTDIMYQILFKDDEPSKVGMISFYGDPDREISYKKATNVSHVLMHTYLIAKPIGVGLDPISLGGRTLQGIMCDRDSLDFYYLSRAWDVISSNHPVLKYKNLLELSFVVSNVAKAKRTPSVPFSVDLDAVFKDVKFDVVWNSYVNGSAVTRRCGSTSNSLKSINMGDWKCSKKVWQSFLKYLSSTITPISREIKWDSIAITVIETVRGGNIIVANPKDGDAFKKYNTRFNSQDDPWKILARGILGFQNMAYVEVPTVSNIADLSPIVTGNVTMDVPSLEEHSN